ncbi:hypothetical protein N6B72_07115 [Chryseobacterium soli]|uniref:glycine-rich domain-containing protein n=1 Tax=Chryseobacterium soli TaxID=445961 RepID=UPI002954E468|nr:hypothetical protein [Chryseobacterium soli]MDV7696684.1 hypothetical protein [Chryseobacterium soli]
METKVALQNDDLWNRIRHFSLDEPDVDFPFSKKLAKEEMWSLDFTQKAITEYKRFIYLCCIMPNGASPSETVDKVWHMHLVYTQNYWEEFCPDILQRKLHHHPSKGGFKENDKHQNWLSDTLRSYKEIFQQDAPGEIWGNQDKIQLQKNNWFRKFRVIPFFVFFLMLTSCLGEAIGAILPVLLAVAIITTIGIIIYSLQNNDHNQNSSDGGTCGSGCSSGNSCGGGGSCGGGCGSGCGGCSS